MADKADIAVEVLGASIANKVTGTGAAAGVAGWLAQINWLGLTGVVIAVLGLVANVYFQRRRERRETTESEARERREAAREEREAAESAARIEALRYGGQQ